jgi:tRNA/tmRNA/rRNA uracil-C5-methylase (TrmA/RlmC/RlmD family)
MNFEQIVEQLKQCEVQGGVWIDAGCGNGTYSFPLSTLVSEVIALDKNKNNLSYLESKITSNIWNRK